MECSEADIEMIRTEASRALGDLDTADATRRLLDESGNFDAALWRLASDLGWLGISVPEVDGGLDMGLAARCAVAEELGRAIGSIPYAVTTSAMAVIARFGTPEQRALLPAGISGQRIFTVALFEPGDASPVAESVTRFANGQITGIKAAVTAGAFAHHALVACADGVALVDLDQPLVGRDVADSIDNPRGFARLSFDGAEAALLGGLDVRDALLDELAVVSAFEQVGGAAACLSATCDYALQRRAFGQVIGAFQAVKHGLADFYVLLQIARGAALSALDAREPDWPEAAAAARLAATRAYDHCAQEAIQLHGGIGTTWEAPQHLHLRRSRSLAQEWGTPAFWRDRLLHHALAMGQSA